MVNPQLLDYIKQQRSQGVSVDVVKNSLQQNGGWQLSDIEEAFAVINAGQSVPTSYKPTIVATNTNVNNKSIFLNNLSKIIWWITLFGWGLFIAESSTPFISYVHWGSMGLWEDITLSLLWWGRIATPAVIIFALSLVLLLLINFIFWKKIVAPRLLILAWLFPVLSAVIGLTVFSNSSSLSLGAIIFQLCFAVFGLALELFLHHHFEVRYRTIFSRNSRAFVVMVSILILFIIVAIISPYAYAKYGISTNSQTQQTYPTTQTSSENQNIIQNTTVVATTTVSTPVKVSPPPQSLENTTNQNNKATPTSTAYKNCGQVNHLISEATPDDVKSMTCMSQALSVCSPASINLGDLNTGGINYYILPVKGQYCPLQGYQIANNYPTAWVCNIPISGIAQEATLIKKKTDVVYGLFLDIANAMSTSSPYKLYLSQIPFTCASSRPQYPPSDSSSPNISIANPSKYGGILFYNPTAAMAISWSAQNLPNSSSINIDLTYMNDQFLPSNQFIPISSGISPMQKNYSWAIDTTKLPYYSSQREYKIIISALDSKGKTLASDSSNWFQIK